ncbi:MAG TPA: carbon monoxide dehydrogenase subunit G [Casimicrobiaceae bacterium]|nr:carbon monoxide dehydrogenase subunit G [Casimicrobiaceae bacterium]
MELSNTRIVPAAPPVVWAALNDPTILKTCLPGCESLERSGDNAYEIVMAARVGPVSARFNGRMTMSDIDPPTAYTLQFEGQGGAAGFVRGEARVTLTPEGEQHTSMTYRAKAQVGGKLAQIGSRLVDGAAAKLTDDFFARFVARLTPVQPGVAGTASSAAPLTVTDDAATPPPLAPPGGSVWIRYAAIAAIIVVLIVLYTRGYR